MDKLEIKSGGFGANTHIMVNGVELKSVKKIVFEAEATEYNKVTITFIANVDLEAEVRAEDVYFEVEE